LKVDPGKVLVAENVRSEPAHFGPSLDAVATGVGFTVTVYANGGIRLQPKATGVMIYTTLIGDVVVLISVSVMAGVLPEAAGLLIPGTAPLVHTSVVPDTAVVIV
jgi:hypothetical protein